MISLKLKLKIYLKNKCNFKKKEKVVIIDFGSQVTKLIARRVSELGVYSEVVTPQELKKFRGYENIEFYIFRWPIYCDK